MKKKLWLLLLVCITLVVGCGKKEEVQNNDNQSNENSQNNSILDNKTEIIQGELKFENIILEKIGASNIVNGKVTNNSKEVKVFKATLKMYNKPTGRLLGRLSTNTITLQPGESTNFSISIMGDYTTVDEFKVEAEYK